MIALVSSFAVATLAMVFDLTVIIHGYQFTGKLPPWTIDLAKSINAQQDIQEDQKIIEMSIVPYDGIDPNAPSQYLIYDWAGKSKPPSSADNDEVVNPLYQAIERRLTAHVAKEKRPMHIHFISHSRGCYVANSVMKKMRKEGLDKFTGLIQWTSLDPASFGDTPLQLRVDEIVTVNYNYLQRRVRSRTKSTTVIGGINIDLTDLIRQWNLPLTISAHSAVRYWYHWRHLDGSEDINYSDSDNLKIKKQFLGNEGSDIRKDLFGTSVIVTNFNRDTELPIELQRNAQINDGELVLTESKKHVRGLAFAREETRGPFVVDFIFRMDLHGGLAGVRPADGIAAVVIPGNKNINALDDTGGNLGYTGLPGTAVVFDTYSNYEFGDERDPWNHVSLRLKGSPKYISIPGSNLPEASNSGNRFRMIGLFLDRDIHLCVYSFGRNQCAYISKKLPLSYRDQVSNRLVLTAATGAGWQRHVIDDLIIAPILPK